MSAPALVAPPIRVCLEDAYSRAAAGRDNPPPATEKQWYLYWQALGDRVSGLVGYGRSDQRPDAGSVPDGGLYMQIDPGYVIYQSIGGEWHYVAGTMYGTIVPDQRPTGLGANDAGFEFRSIDTDPLLGGHHWIWSGSAWIEVTPNRYGTHAARLAQPVAQTWNGMLWVETDRSEVIYQNQSGVWHFLAGTMWGTLSPDQRPTDLGANDAGFTFRATDVVRSFIWSGSVWVDSSAGYWLPGTAGAIYYTGGNVGIGTATPQAQLEVAQGARIMGYTIPTTGAGIEIAYFPPGPYGAIQVVDRSAGAYQQLHLVGAPLALNAGAGGNVGIGTTSPASLLSFGTTNPNINSRIALFENPGSTNFRGIGMANPGAGVYGVAVYANVTPTNNNYTMFVSDTGLVAIGSTIPSYQLHLTNDSAAKPGTATWTVASDVRVKQNVEEVTDDSLAILEALNWIRFEYNGLGSTPKDQKAIGLSAQDAQKHLPEAVRGVKGKLAESDQEETELLGIDYHHIIVHAARAIQQLSAEIKALKQKP